MLWAGNVPRTKAEGLPIVFERGAYLQKVLTKERKKEKVAKIDEKNVFFFFFTKQNEGKMVSSRSPT